MFKARIHQNLQAMLRLCSVTLVKMHLVIYSKLPNEPNMTFKRTNPTLFLNLKCQLNVKTNNIRKVFLYTQLGNFGYKTLLVCLD